MPRSTRQQPSTKGEETRAMILRHSLAMASRVGLHGLSIGAVAKVAGMSKSGIFAHFDSKEDLQLQVLQTAVERFIEKVVMPALRGPRGEPRVRALFENWLDWFEARSLPGGCPFVGAAAELDDRPGPLRDYLVSNQKDALAAMITATRIAVQEGHFRADVDVDQFAHDVYSTLLAYHHFSRLLDDPLAADRARRAFEGLIHNARSTEFRVTAAATAPAH
ncbi:MAG: TetR/AcrR family transcriptional regulator [Acidobacteriota bacterium]